MSYFYLFSGICHFKSPKATGLKQQQQQQKYSHLKLEVTAF